MPDEKDRKVYSVSELTRSVKTMLESGFSSVLVEGEISKYTVVASGHAYFSIKDEKSVVDAVMWKGKNALLQFTPKPGDKVLIRCKPTIYEPQSRYQIVVDSMEPKGLGALQAAFDELKKKLIEEGLFDKKHKKPLPYISWSVGIVTSPTGAVIQDMIRTLSRRFPGIRIVLAPVPVQGDGAAEKIGAAIRAFNRYGKVDVIIVGRGGGSLEDLWAFNQEVLARAIFESEIPVVSAVGHETDFTIADFVADLRASTPTGAAEQVAPVRAEVEERIDRLFSGLCDKVRDMTESRAQLVDDYGERIFRGVSTLTAHTKERMAGAIRHLGALTPKARFLNMESRFDQLSKELVKSLARMRETKKTEATALEKRLRTIKPASWIVSYRKKVDQTMEMMTNRAATRMTQLANGANLLEGRLNAISPLAVLERGYSIVTSPDERKIYKSVDELKAGQKVKIRMSDGSTGATVHGKGTSKQEDLF
ncbi:Exodeoxyribonuclease VII large subunit [hydrothermal vent metagenome]|uniref:Exodeoxyribonuclease VII large subunit n=1 Tax=hydrothermal vent metagenome TaxID=652676 RepID=A0A3B1C7R8_9ZZZZ